MSRFDELQDDITRLVNVIPVENKTRNEIRKIITNMVVASCSRYNNDAEFKKEIDQYIDKNLT